MNDGQYQITAYALLVASVAVLLAACSVSALAFVSGNPLTGSYEGAMAIIAAGVTRTVFRLECDIRRDTYAKGGK